MPSTYSVAGFLFPCLLSILTCSNLLAEDPEFSAQDLEWFEREVRPLLLERCSSCHSQKIGNRKGGLSIDDRQSILVGGDSGPSVVPGKVNASLLIEAVRRESFEMPPEKPLSSRELQILEDWVTKGAPWPAVALNSEEGDWLQTRLAEHWAWRPVTKPEIPQIEHDNWSWNAIDRFILKRLRRQGVSPADDCGVDTFFRRLSFDLTGLPPTHLQPPNPSATNLVEVIDCLIASPQFGVRWGRHWLDLVRYAETLGHEFDFPVHHVWRYRDAVIDTLNQDVSYAQFVSEHLAGDLLETPRLHTTSGVNQSLALTGAWWLGDTVHAPTDIQNDWARRVDNQIDVISKAFMGMTVACARCHDHKFDAISVDDYYGLAGIIKSSRRVYFPTDPLSQITKFNQHTEQQLQSAQQTALLSLAQLQLSSPEIARQWLDEYIQKLNTLETPKKEAELQKLHVFEVLSKTLDRTEESFSGLLRSFQADAHAKTADYQAWFDESELFAQFDGMLPAGWRIHQADARPIPSLFVDSDDLDWFSSGLLPVPHRATQLATQQLGRSQHVTLQSPDFKLQHPMVCVKVRGERAISSLVVDNYFMNEFHTLLFGDTHKTIDQLRDSGWITHAGDVQKYRGRNAYLSLEDTGSGWFEVEEVRFADRPAPSPPSHFSVTFAPDAVDNLDALLNVLSQEIARAFGELSEQEVGSLSASARATIREVLAIQSRHQLTSAVFETLENQARVIQGRDQETPAPTILLSTTEFTPRNSAVAIRGNPKERGSEVPRVCLAQYAEAPAATSSGRLELANSLTSGKHPLTSRVIVNRVWHHLMGRGIVQSTDNLGVLGGRPSHPELLDYLAAEFVSNDWSLKWLIREIVTSHTYRLSSSPGAQQRELDPDASLWSHRPVRRLSAEALRDSLLAVSGSLDYELEGKSIPVHLNDQMTGRGRPSNSGPLDGGNRRSIYLEIRRNFIPPLMLAFDFPMPSTTSGNRTVSNVPAQALGLLNDPLVQEVVRRWVEHSASMKERRKRVQTMLQRAYGRPVTETELQRCLKFLNTSGEDGWYELAHVIVNSKEFSFIQ